MLSDERRLSSGTGGRAVQRRMTPPRRCAWWLGRGCGHCRVHVMRNVLARVPKVQKSMVPSMVKRAFTQVKPEDAQQ